MIRAKTLTHRLCMQANSVSVTGIARPKREARPVCVGTLDTAGAAG